MARFKDRTGREWTVEIPGLGAVAKLRTETGFDLNRIDAHESFVSVLTGDAEQIAAAIWFLVKYHPPAISFEAFLDAIDAPALAAAKLALVDAVFDFFHHGRAATMKSRLRQILANEVLSGSSDSDGSSPASAVSVPPI